MRPHSSAFVLHRLCRRDMKMNCAECECVVEAGSRIETCTAETDCCCADVPIMEGSGASRPSPSAGVG